jgi:hypothetical protein
VQCPLYFLISPVACFIVHNVTWLVYDDIMQYLLCLVTQVSPFPNLPLTLDKEVAEYNYACVCYSFGPPSGICCFSWCWLQNFENPSLAMRQKGFDLNTKLKIICGKSAAHQNVKQVGKMA